MVSLMIGAAPLYMSLHLSRPSASLTFWKTSLSAMENTQPLATLKQTQSCADGRYDIFVVWVACES